MPLFSLIVPTYNSGNVIEQCLQSILSQRFLDYEVLILDGLSSDYTNQIIEKIITANPQISIKKISEKDKGVYDAMNKGIRMARGTWLYFLGSDDYLYDADVLANVAAFIGNQAVPAHFVYGNISSPPLGDHFDGPYTLEKICRYNICHQGIFYHKSVFASEGFYNLKYRVFADWDLNLRCFFNAAIRKQHIDRTIAYYSDGGLSATTDDTVFRSDLFGIVRNKGYGILPLRKLKFYCTSNRQFFFFAAKRFLRF